MKKSLSIIAWILALLMITSLFACAPANDPEETAADSTQNTETAAETDSPEDVTSAALEAFDSASNALLESEKLHMDVQISRSIAYGTDVIETTIVRGVDYSAIGKDNFLAVIEDKNIVGKKVYNTIEVYSEGTEYLLITDDGTVGYCAEGDAESFLDRQVPAVLIDPELYGDVKTDGDTLVFSSPTAPEAFTASERIELISAEGKVTLTDGAIEKMSYTITYESGPAKVTESYTSKVDPGASDASIYDVPVKEACLQVESVTVPALMYYSKTAAYGLTALKAENKLTLISEAVGMVWEQSQTLSYYESQRIPFTGVQSIEVNVNHNGEQTSYPSEYRFEDGIATYTSNGSTETIDMTADDFKDQLLYGADTAVEFSYITSIDGYSEAGDYVIIDYSVDESSADHYKTFVCENIYTDPGYLDSIATSYEHLTMEGYLTIDRDTLLPVSDAIVYSGAHTIEGVTYALGYSREVKLFPATDDAYVEITADVLPTDAPEKQATPLFYEVTSPEGNKMYLLGTIHVGDGRTSHLPDEIYDALAASDALAVESNVLDVEENLETDAELMAAMSQAYYYLDGTTLADHVSAESYEKAAALSKVFGLHTYLDVLKPSVIANEIELVSINSGRAFSSERGVDMLLSRLAKKQHKDILEVETPADHYGTFSKYSEALQAYLLDESMSTPRSVYLDDTAELYEMWCEGDEAKLREYLSTPEIPEDADEDELALYNEYMSVILTDRDAIMAAKAKEYLSDEKVEFFAVGLAHLLSDTGLVDSLREAGYTVEPVEYK